MPRHLHLVFALALAGAGLTAAGSAGAGSLLISPASSLANVGDTLNFQVDGSGFAEVVVGGGFDLSFDPTVLQFTGGSIAGIWEFAPSLGSVSPVSSHVSALRDVSFSSFVNNTTGNFAVATLNFKAVGNGTSALTLAPSGLFDFSDSGGNPLTPTLGSATATVPVPEAGTLAMTLAGMLLLLGVRHRQAWSAAGPPQGGRRALGGSAGAQRPAWGLGQSAAKQ